MRKEDFENLTLTGRSKVKKEQRKVEEQLSDENLRMDGVTGGGMFGKCTNVAK